MDVEVRLTKHEISKHLGVPYPFAVHCVSEYIDCGATSVT